MSDLRQAAQQALEALESSRIFVTTREKTKHPEGTEWYDSAITALREALEQSEQEPTCPECKAGVLYECVACSSNNYPLKTEQKPVAFYHPHKGFYWAKPTHISAPTVVDVPPMALYTAEAQPEPVAMRMPKVGDKVICLEDESIGEVVSLTAGGSPDITFDDGLRGTYLLSEFAELFGYVTAAQRTWVGLTDADWRWVADKKGTSLDTFDQGAAWAQARLKERNND